LYAMKDIQRANEITIDYLCLETFSGREHRKSELLEHWGFDCHCQACFLPNVMDTRLAHAYENQEVFRVKIREVQKGLSVGIQQGRAETKCFSPAQAGRLMECAEMLRTIGYDGDFLAAV